MKAPCVSIIVPVYNVEKWLPPCIDSLLNQTYENFQLILIDDGSTDNSANICDEYAKQDSRIEVIHKKNGGLSSARNTGIELAVGDFLCFVDGDDFCEKDMLKIAMENFSENIDIVAFGFYRNSKRVIAKKNKVSNNFDEAINLYVSGELNISAWGKVYRKNIFENLRFPEGKLFEDMWTFPKIAENKILVLNKALYNYVLRDNSITTTFTPEHLDFLLSMDLWKEAAKKYGKKTEKLIQIVNLRVAWGSLLFLENKHLRKDNEIYAEQFVQILRTEKKCLVPIKGFFNFILANMVAYGFSYSFVLSLRKLLKRFKQFFPFS